MQTADIHHVDRPIEFSLEQMAKIAEIRTRYPEGRHKSALLPVLHIAQVEFGWCSVEVMNLVAKVLEITPVEVYEVASFYSMYHLTPVGNYVFEFCHTGPCSLMGADRVLEYLKKKLGIEVGQTTPDGMFTIKTVECLAACGYAPMMQVGEKYHEHLTESRVDEIIAQYRKESATLRPQAKGSHIGGPGAMLGRGH